MSSNEIISTPENFGTTLRVAIDKYLVDYSEDMNIFFDNIVYDEKTLNTLKFQIMEEGTKGKLSKEDLGIFIEKMKAADPSNVFQNVEINIVEHPVAGGDADEIPDGEIVMTWQNSKQ